MVKNCVKSTREQFTSNAFIVSKQNIQGRQMFGEKDKNPVHRIVQHI